MTHERVGLLAVTADHRYKRWSTHTPNYLERQFAVTDNQVWCGDDPYLTVTGAISLLFSVYLQENQWANNTFADSRLTMSTEMVRETP